jgi:hypothetical protein
MNPVQARVKRRDGPKDKMGVGRGFSIGELSEIGLSTSAARRLGIAADVRRKTKHQENVDGLHEWLKSTGKSIPELSKAATPVRREVRSGPHTGRVYRGLTSAGKRGRGLLRSRI